MAYYCVVIVLGRALPRISAKAGWAVGLLQGISQIAVDGGKPVAGLVSPGPELCFEGIDSIVSPDSTRQRARCPGGPRGLSNPKEEEEEELRKSPRSSGIAYPCAPLGPWKWLGDTWRIWACALETFRGP